MNNEDSGDNTIKTVEDCPLCYHKLQKKIVAEYNSIIAIEDGYPVSEGHHLLIPKRHTSDYFSLTEGEKQDVDKLMHSLRKRLLESDPTITGFNIGINCGESAGQTIFHCHIHLIPRRDGDTPDPRGGIRGAIPGKMGY